MAQQPHFWLRVVTPPAAQPLTIDQAKAHLRIDTDADDDYVTDLISLARECVEDWTGRALLTTTYRMSMDRFPLLPNSQYSPGNPSVLTPVVNNVWPLDASAWAITLPRSPLISIASINYTATNGSTQTMDPSTYMVDSDGEPPRIAPLAGAFWPPVMWQPDSVQITFTAGYASPSAVPAGLRHAMRLLMGHWYENREAAAPMKLEQAPFGLAALLAKDSTGYIW